MNRPTFRLAPNIVLNPGDVDLEVIEVQSGTYLGEDDIVRFGDIYGRHDDSRHEDAKNGEAQSDQRKLA